MEVEAAVNRLEALVEKVDSDLDYAVERLASEFSVTFKDELQNEINPVRLIERIQKAKKDFKILISESEDIEVGQKKMTKVLYAAISDPMNQIHQVQVQAGIHPSKNPFEELTLISRECDRAENEAHTQFTNGTGMCKDKTPPFLRGKSKDFVSVTQEEFMGLSDLVRGRSKLEDVNQVYEVLFGYFKKNPKGSLTLKDMTKMGLKVSGATGGAKLKVLKTLKIIQINKQGNVKML